jgi:hypothetical protein
MEIVEINVGDVVRLKKKHPCGSDLWRVVRVGADIGIRCEKCHRRVLLSRGVFERRVREVLSEGGDAADQDTSGVSYGSS